MNMRVFGSILLLAALVLLALGSFLWVTGAPDDGRYRVLAANPLELIAKNRQPIERRNAAHVPLLLGALATVIGGAVVISTRGYVQQRP